MKSFKNHISEVAQPEPAEEKKFKDQHKVDIKPHPVAPESQHKGVVKPKAKRKADQEGDANYDMAYESAEQLDELSPNTLHSYIKKAAGNMAGNAAVAAAQASSSMKKSSPDVKRNMKNRMRGITGASGRLADKANQNESVETLEENEAIGMMMNQLGFIKYAAEEMSEWLSLNTEVEAWFQSKLAMATQQLQTLHGYMEGERNGEEDPFEDMYGESLEEGWGKKVKKEELSGGQKKLDHNKNGKIDAHDFHMMRKKKKNEEVEQIDEISKEKMGQYIKRAHADKDTQTKRASIFDKKGMDADKDKDMYSAWDKADKARKKAGNRTKFIGKAVDRITKEEVELDEVSQKTLWNYHAKAGADLQKKREKLDKGTLTMKDLKKGQNRVKGLNRAADKMHEEEQIDEVTRSAVKRPVNITDKDGKTRTVYKNAKTVSRDEHGQEKINTNESVLDEAFKAGIVKFADKSSMVVKKEDADILNSLFKSLSGGNRKKMEEVAMRDKKGFAEILGFAKEAL